MNTKMRNLTLTAAALAALTVLAPKASAQNRPPGGGNAPRHGTSSPNGGGHNGGGHGSYGGGRATHGGSSTYGYGYRGGYGTRYVAPARPYVRYGYGYGYGYPYRTYAGFRFYPAFPGPGYVYIANLGWALPPFFGAVWVPGHYDIGGFWVEGFWR